MQARSDESGSSPSDPSNSPTMMSPALTQHGIILGTAAYMSPEQARGRSVDRRADIWAFGCVIYEMLTGRTAFGGASVADAFSAIVRDEPDWARLSPAVGPKMRALLRRCLEKDPRQRLRDIGDGRLALDDAIAADDPLETSADRPSLAWAFSIAALSPDGRFLAYTSTESGVTEVFVEALSDGFGRWQVSTDGGMFPVWSHDGGEIVYVRGDTMMRVEVEIGTTLQLGLPEPLFRSPIDLQTPPTRNFDMLRDGRFIMSGRSDDLVDRPEILITANL